jgi:hypothetical protein
LVVANGTHYCHIAEKAISKCIINSSSSYRRRTKRLSKKAAKSTSCLSVAEKLQKATNSINSSDVKNSALKWRFIID